MGLPEKIGIPESLAQTFGNRANAHSVFAQPIERAGVTVVPVGKVRYGFGGGSNREEGQEGAGGGGGVLVTPIGYIEIRDGKSRFRRIPSPAFTVQLFMGFAFAAWILMKGLRTLREIQIGF